VVSARDSLALSDERERVLTRLLQLALVGLAGYGLVTGSSSVAVNAAGALLVTALPALLRREVGLRIDFGIALWLTVAVLLHAVGILGPYRNVWWYDYVTHALSASVVAGIGYLGVLPTPMPTVEFAGTEISEALGVNSVLVVFGISDIVTDLVFTSLGGLVVVLWGRGYFRSLATKLGRFFRYRPAE